MLIFIALLKLWFDFMIQVIDKYVENGLFDIIILHYIFNPSVFLAVNGSISTTEAMYILLYQGCISESL